ncbi:hypothetical protein F4861DRAFT_529149 [Xylaria intraflava]|nr:hypothetical protein F4861DRAFT_529149 [Xylaria intraflava]
MEKNDGPRGERVLLTDIADSGLISGGSGFIASHVLDSLLNAGFRVVVTARSEEKGQRIVDSVKPHHLSYVLVDDIAKPGSFDPVFQSQTPFDYVVHTASPYHLNVQDPVKDFIDPAVKGTTGLLRSIKTYGPSVKRVVITSSSAAMLNPGNHPKVYDETIWARTTLEDAINNPKLAYKASKVLAERAAWDFVANEKPNFDLAVINCTYVFGPIQRSIPSLEAMNTSNHRIRDLMLGKMKAGLPPTAPVFTWVDVRDVALAHLRAITVPEAGGNRFYVVGGYFTNKRIADVIRERFTSLADRLPVDGVDDLPSDMFEFNNGRSRELLGLSYRSLEESVGDTAMAAHTPQAVLPRQVITQTITYPDYTTTAVVTLGAGDPSSVPTTPSDDAQSSRNSPSPNAGIITGAVVGAIVLALVIWMGCIVRRRMIEAEIREYENQREAEMAAYDDFLQQPPRTYWPQFPMSIPPPDVPTYRATSPRSMYTSYGETGTAATPHAYEKRRRRR